MAKNMKLQQPLGPLLWYQTTKALDICTKLGARCFCQKNWLARKYFEPPRLAAHGLKKLGKVKKKIEDSELQRGDTKTPFESQDAAHIFMVNYMPPTYTNNKED
jgi:hypothetical protein